MTIYFVSYTNTEQDKIGKCDNAWAHYLHILGMFQFFESCYSFVMRDREWSYHRNMMSHLSPYIHQILHKREYCPFTVWIIVCYNTNVHNRSKVYLSGTINHLTHRMIDYTYHSLKKYFSLTTGLLFGIHFLMASSKVLIMLFVEMLESTKYKAVSCIGICNATLEPKLL